MTMPIAQAIAILLTPFMSVFLASLIRCAWFARPGEFSVKDRTWAFIMMLFVLPGTAFCWGFATGYLTVTL